MRHRTFDVVVSDLAMPQRTGFDLIREIRQDPRTRNVAAIALSAAARDEDREAAVGAGYELHVAKPISPEQLMRTIGSVLSRA